MEIHDADDEEVRPREDILFTPDPTGGVEQEPQHCLDDKITFPRIASLSIRKFLEMQQSSSQESSRDFGNKRVPIPKGITKKSMLTGRTNDGGERSKHGLRAEPTLKNFGENMINLIESEMMPITTETGWSDIAGLDEAKMALREMVVLPFINPDIFKGIRAPPKGVLLIGPPGTGKTMLGRCVASQCKATFFNISASLLTSEWVGEGENLVRAIFAAARAKQPSVLFIDEVESLVCENSESQPSWRIIRELLTQLDGVATYSEEKLIVIGATNGFKELQKTTKKRFAKQLCIPLPGNDSRLCIVRNFLIGMDHTLTDQDYQSIERITEGYSGADMRQLCSEAAMGPIREIDTMTDTVDQIRPISGMDFISAAGKMRETAGTLSD